MKSGDHVPETSDGETEASKEEISKIGFADAIVDPRTMMIHDGNAFAARAAVFGPQRTTNEARVTET